ncbi:Ig-like domain-containing protein [Jeotgalibacillus salarius]|uniref:Glycosyl hydrolase family protein n=1 Tax=Jeotgalibacillus salarius TaxID=546023 RepID=A0A4Y8LII3_9BACL|nr:Ig-like domain-containing protein [Jeotgalibacillus salarius]TFE01501.1 glycosyl hydrolase family protein [Jeotgalibacillus salarius]
MKKAKRMKMLSLVLVTNMLMFTFADVNVSSVKAEEADQSEAASQTITTIAAAGPTSLQVGFDGGVGFEFPNFNNGAGFDAVEDDVDLLVKQDGEWVSIVNNAASGWIYDVNFGNWWEGPGGYWFNPVEETTQVRVASQTNPDVYVEYTLNVTPADTQVITSMAPAGPTTFDVSPSGGTGFEFPRFNSGATFNDVRDDIALFVKQGDEWVSIDNNADSGWIYDNNFGNWWEGPGGYWFDPVEETTQVRVASITNPDVYVDYTLVVTLPVRNSHVISNFDGNATFEADKSGAIGMPIPRIDGGYATKSEIDNFVYEVKVDGEWVNILESNITGFSYSANGYNNASSATQWGFWTDYIFGLWFQPLQEDVALRIGYPLDGEKGGDIGNNYVEYQLIGNPDAFRPDDVVGEDIELGTSEDSAIEGWELVFNDEFDGSELDESKWNYDTGYYLNDDPGTWGWGNNELQHYTDSEDNIFVEDGKLNITALDDPASFEQDPDRVAPYSSGKITTQDKFKFTYGRVDFSAKLPAVSGAWPALWMMPNDEVYGSWASSGEIDVMEARGRVPGTTSGAIHFGGEWPSNTYLSGEQHFEEGGRIDTDFHTYSVVWEEDSINWYVDGQFFYRVTKEQWFSAAVQDNPNAPFDQDFYLIMNLAMGGWFDGGVEPDVDDFPVSMEVDYVRVYKDLEPEEEEIPEVPVTGVTLNKSEVELTKEGQTTRLSAAVAPANATNKKVSWSTSDESVAKVSATGVVTAVANGMTEITVTTEDGAQTAKATVTVDIIPQMTQEQLFPLKNGSFSDGLTEWSAWSWNNENFINEVEVENGKAQISVPAFDAEGTGAEKWAVQFKQTDLQLYADKEYLVSFDASSTIPRDLELVLQNNDFERVFEKEISLTEETERFTYSFTVTEEEAVELNFLLGKYAETDAHSVTIDNVVLEMKNPGVNQVKNPSFADGNTSWDLWSDTGATSTITDGQNQLTIPSIGNEFWSIQFSQTGQLLEKSKSYRLVFDMASSTPRKIDAILENAGFDKHIWETVEINEELKTYAIEFTYEKDTDAAKLLFALGRVEGQEAIGEHTVTIDNVHLYEIPALPAEGPENPEEPSPEREGYGVGTIKENSVEFYVNDAPWAILHYIKNGTTQQNIMMNKAGENYNVFTLDVNEGDEIKYGFTYGLAEGGQDEYAEQTYIHEFSTAPEAPTANEVSDQSTEVTGEAAAGTVVTVSNETESFTGTADADGAYSVSIPKQEAGTVLTVTATDADGNVSEALSITVTDKTAPEAPTANEVSDQSTEVTGEAEAGSTVTISNGTDTFTATADENGEFAVEIPTQEAGTVLVITATDEAGNVSDELSVTVTSTFTVEEVTVQSKEVTGQTEAGAVVTVNLNGKNNKRTVTANEDGEFTVKIPKQHAGTILTITAEDADGNVIDTKTVSVNDGKAPSAPNVQKNVKISSTSVSGKTEANAEVTVKAGEEVIGTAKADDKGKFEVTIEKQKQSTVLSITATDAEGKTSKAAKVTVKK